MTPGDFGIHYTLVLIVLVGLGCLVVVTYGLRDSR